MWRRFLRIKVCLALIFFVHSILHIWLYSDIKIRVAIWRNFHVRTPVNFTRLNEIEARKYEVSRVNVKLSEFQLSRGLPLCLGYPSKRVKVSSSL